MTFLMPDVKWPVLRRFEQKLHKVHCKQLCSLVCGCEYFSKNHISHSSTVAGLKVLLIMSNWTKYACAKLWNTRTKNKTLFSRWCSILPALSFLRPFVKVKYQLKLIKNWRKSKSSVDRPICQSFVRRFHNPNPFIRFYVTATIIHCSILPAATLSIYRTKIAGTKNE